METPVLYDAGRQDAGVTPISEKEEKMGDLKLRQRDGVWYADFFYTDRSGERRRFHRSTGKGKTRKEAEKVARKWRKQARQLGYIPEFEEKRQVFDNQKQPSVTFNGFADKFLEQYVRVRNKPSGYRNAESALRVHWVPWFEGKELRDIRAVEIEEYIAEMIKNGLKPKSVNNYLAVLSKLFNKAIDWELLEKSPMKKGMKLKTSLKQPEFWEEEQVRVFLQMAETSRPDLYPFFLTACLTGMRLGELCGLQWGDVDFVTGKFYVRNNYVRGHLGTPKSGRPREIPIHPMLAKVLKAHRHLKSDFVFAREDGSPLEVNDFRKPFFWLIKKAGLKRITFHQVRHSFASNLVMKGTPLKVVQELLGHGTIQMTEIYAHLGPNVHREAVNTLMAESRVQVEIHECERCD